MLINVRGILTRYCCKKFASVSSSKMDKLRQLQNLSWCKPDWCYPSSSKETTELLRQCADLPTFEPSGDVEELIRRSKAFPIPFPIESVRLNTLKERIPIEELERNIVSTYPLIHERVLLLMTHFLIYKREFGSSIEKAFYKDMTVPEFIDRILQKRAVTFMNANDSYLLLNGAKGEDGWELIGTMQQREPLVLENCLSYDEMKLSSMVYVSGHTACLNDGDRHNCGRVQEKGTEPNAVIIGIIGSRFERPERMDYEDIVVTEAQNCAQNGYGEEVTPTTCLDVLKTTYVRNSQSARHYWRQMWAEFYQVPSYTYPELSSYINSGDKDDERRYSDRFVTVLNKNAIFDNEAYYKRLSIIAESVLLEAEARAAHAGKDAFVNIIGAGLGVWKISDHQSDVFLLTWLERARGLLRRDALAHVSDVNLAYVRASPTVRALFTNTTDGNSENAEMRIFLESKRHPKGGINVQLEDRSPSAALSGAHAGKLLVMTYPWDGNAQPGNEFWLGSLDGSGDPAAAASTQVAELHNALVNPAVSARRARVARPAVGAVARLQDYCRQASAV